MENLKYSTQVKPGGSQKVKFRSPRKQQGGGGGGQRRNAVHQSPVEVREGDQARGLGSWWKSLGVIS